MLDRGIENVFVAIEIERIGRARLAALIERTDIAAGAERTLARALDDDRLHLFIARPGVKLRRHRQRHVARQRVERLGPVERDQPDGAALLEEDFSVRHAASYYLPLVGRSKFAKQISGGGAVRGVLAPTRKNASHFSTSPTKGEVKKIVHHCLNISRATITRMISLVPSRI